MNIPDKILLMLLIILLPIGIFLSRQLLEPTAEVMSDQKSEQLKKIETLLDQLADNQNPSQDIITNPQTPPVGLIISQVEFASNSGTLKIKGTQANFNTMVRISLVEYQPETPAVQNSAVANAKALGKPVVIEAVKPNADGSFEYEYLPEKNTTNIDITVDQLGQTDTIVFDLSTNKLVYEANP